MKTLNKVFFSTFLFVMVITNANAAIVYDNDVSVSHIMLSSEFQDGSSTWAQADNFTLLNKSVITDVHWKGTYYPTDSPQDDFIIRIYGDDGGLPTAFGTEIYSYSVSSANRTDIGSLYTYSTLIDPFVAQAGQTYWLEIFNQFDNAGWWWGGIVDGGDGIASYRLEPDGGAWINGLGSGFDTDFQLTGHVVPEPSTFLLLGAGLAGLAFVARRRMKE